jgi:hypothetical protein
VRLCCVLHLPVLCAPWVQRAQHPAEAKALCRGVLLRLGVLTASEPTPAAPVKHRFLGWCAASLDGLATSEKARGAARRSVAVGNAAGSETPEWCTDTASSRNGGVKRARRLFAPPVTCVATGVSE